MDEPHCRHVARRGLSTRHAGSRADSASGCPRKGKTTASCRTAVSTVPRIGAARAPRMARRGRMPRSPESVLLAPVPEVARADQRFPPCKRRREGMQWLCLVTGNPLTVAPLTSRRRQREGRGNRSRRRRILHRPAACWAVRDWRRRRNSLFVMATPPRDNRHNRQTDPPHRTSSCFFPAALFS